MLRLNNMLKMETTAVYSLKRQLLEFSEIAARNKSMLRVRAGQGGQGEAVGKWSCLQGGVGHRSDARNRALEKKEDAQMRTTVHAQG